jgi:hypothetical protein
MTPKTEYENIELNTASLRVEVEIALLFDTVIIPSSGSTGKQISNSLDVPYPPLRTWKCHAAVRDVDDQSTLIFRTRKARNTDTLHCSCNPHGTGKGKLEKPAITVRRRAGRELADFQWVSRFWRYEQAAPPIEVDRSRKRGSVTYRTLGEGKAMNWPIRSRLYSKRRESRNQTRKEERKKKRECKSMIARDADSPHDWNPEDIT